MNLVQSKDIILDEKCRYQYISVIETLKTLLLNDDIWDEINRVHHGNYMQDFSDGDYFKDHPIINGCNKYLRIHLYTDEFEVVNPLGSKRTIHKLVAFYFIISNIRPKYRSKLKHIYLSILCEYSVIKKITYNKILEPLIKDFNILKNEGFTINKDGKSYNIKAILCTTYTYTVRYLRIIYLHIVLEALLIVLVVDVFVDIVWHCTRILKFNLKKVIMY